MQRARSDKLPACRDLWVGRTAQAETSRQLVGHSPLMKSWRK